MRTILFVSNWPFTLVNMYYSNLTLILHLWWAVAIGAQRTLSSPDTVMAPLYDGSSGPCLVPKASTSKAMFCRLSECIKFSMLDPTAKVKIKKSKNEVKQRSSNIFKNSIMSLKTYRNKGLSKDLLKKAELMLWC